MIECKQLALFLIILFFATSFHNAFAAGDFTVVFPIMNVENPQIDIDILKPYMTQNDIVLFPAENYTSVLDLPNDIPGLKLGTGGTSISNLLPSLSLLPSDITYITYDYERGWSPEWTDGFDTSMDYFRQLHDATQQAGKKFMPFPVFVLSVDWNWGEVVKNSDILVVQVMNWQTNGTQTPDSITPEALDITLEELTDFLVQQRNIHSPDTKIFYQLGFFQTNNTDSVLYDINRVKAHGLDGIVVVYNRELTGATSNVYLAKELFEKYRTQPQLDIPCTNCDTDNDGVQDSVDNCTSKSNVGQIDSDLDGFGDACDIDDDGDSVVTLGDNCPTVFNPDQVDSDNDGVGNACADLDNDGVDIRLDNCPTVANTSQIDSDGDKLGDACDLDNDADRVPDTVDNCLGLANTTQMDIDGDKLGDACDIDMDNDGISNTSDNCPMMLNTTQLDSDADGIGNICDNDIDNDTVLNTNDNCPTVANTSQTDSDLDGFGDTCDLDMDNDGISNTSDNCPTTANTTQNDVDTDRIGDVCDVDMDNDTRLNTNDNCPLVGNTSQTDSDNDGVGNSCDLPSSTSVSAPYIRKAFVPTTLNKSITGGTDVSENVQILNIIAPSCDMDICTNTNSVDFGTNSSSSQTSYVREVLTFDLTNSNIIGSKIKNMTLDLGGCWHGGKSRICDNSDNPGFSSGGNFLVAIWDWIKWQPFNNSVSLGSYSDSTADTYKSYKISKSSGFVNNNVQNNKIKILLQTSGTTYGKLDVHQVLDYSYVTITYQN